MVIIEIEMTICSKKCLKILSDKISWHTSHIRHRIDVSMHMNAFVVEVLVLILILVHTFLTVLKELVSQTETHVPRILSVVFWWQ